jgi:NTE family protein
MANRALVMSGGGSRGAFQLGAADYLVNDRGLDFQVIAGVSTGSLNAVLLAQGAGLEGLKASLGELRSLWSGIRSARDVFSSRFLGQLFVLFAKDSVYSTKPLAELIARHVSPERLQASGRQLRIGAVGLETGDFMTVDQANPGIRDWALASAAIPLMFPPVSIGDQTAVDGGVRNLTPLEGAFTALKSLGSGDGEPDEMYVVLASPLGLEVDRTPRKSGLAIAKRAAAILMNEIFREDLSYALAINDSVSGYQELRRRLSARIGRDDAEEILGEAPFPFRPPKFRHIPIWTIVPDTVYSEALEFDPVKIEQAFEAGREAARSPLGEGELRQRLAA